MRIKTLWLLALLLYQATLRGQADWQADTVHIAQQRLQTLASGHRLLTLDSALLTSFRGQNLAELLSQHSDVFIKTYGSGGLATTSLRGAGASHTAILWNGFALPSPMNGQLDLSLIPLYFVDRLQVQYGGSAALFGSGAVGGALHLDSQTDFAQGLRVSGYLQGGRYGLIQPGGDVQISQTRWLSRTRWYHHQATHDFPLVNAYQDQAPRHARQVHAAVQQQGLMQENAWRLTERQTLRAWLWVQQADRQLPPTLSQDTSVATQADQSLRLALQWQRRDLHWDWSLRSGLFREALHYQDSLARISSDNRALTLITQGEGSWRMGGGHSLHLGLLHQWQQAQAPDGYGDALPTQTQLAALFSYRYVTPQGRWQASANVRQESLLGQASRWLPLLPSVNLRGQLWPTLELHAQVGRSFRLPTFNDRYWSPGGNPELHPEQGWGSELGLNWQPQTQGAWRGELGATVFHQLIDQWILWRPSQQGYWSPENVQQVRARGLESQVSGHWQGGPWQADLSGGYTYTRSTVEAVSRPSDRSLGQQLIYTPLHQGQAGFWLRYRTLGLRYQHTLTGQRLTATDGSASLPAYDLGHLSLSAQWQCPHWRGQLTARIDNLWQEAYQVMANRAMPLQQASVTLQVSY
jgi:iron complex outermembrane receptor protein